jgi:hypothetical protein
MNPPENAIVLCIDEKTQIQALDRTQPELPVTLLYILINPAVDIMNAFRQLPPLIFKSFI